MDIVWDEAWTTDRLADSARAKLRFLPAPAEVPDPTTYVEGQLSADAQPQNLDEGDPHDR
ncbi:MAG: hypothetical protein ACRDO2_00505 [Nocardioidaceae bacterium]